MRILRAISDIPWWFGLPIFLIGNLIVPFGIISFIIGIIVSFFGCWVFSKLLPCEENPQVGFAALGILLFFLVMSIPYKFNYSLEFLAWMNSITPLTLYSVRAALGLFIGLITFNKGFKR